MMPAKLTYRQTKTGTWVAFGPTSAITAGTTVTVTKRDGTTKTEQIESVGRPFTVDGQQMCYGYLAARASAPTTRTPARATHMCDECGQRRATTTARDLSGIPGRVCRRCKAEEGSLSFA